MTQPLANEEPRREAGTEGSRLDPVKCLERGLIHAEEE